MQSLGNLSIFVRVAQLGSFTDAANSLDMSPSAASRAVARLEKSLQVKLFHRTTRSLSLTVEGEKLKAGAESILSDWRDIEDDLARVQKAPSGPLKLSIPSGLGRNLFVPLLVRFQQEFPLVNLDVSFDDKMVDLANDGFDVVVRTGELADSASHIARKFFDFDVHLCASPGYLGSHAPITKAADVAEHRCVRIRNKATGRLFAWPSELQIDSPSETLVFDDGDGVTQALLAGAGLGVLPSWLCAPWVRRGELVCIDVDYHYPSPPVWLVYLNRRYVSARIQSMVDFLIAERETIVRELDI